MEQLVAPKQETVDAIATWLDSHGLAYTALSPSGDMLSIDLSPDQANALLNANYSVYTHTASGTNMLRTLSYSLPADLSPHVSFIYPTTQ